jgi:long-chain acyl-CoA synthetase
MSADTSTSVYPEVAAMLAADEQLTGSGALFELTQRTVGDRVVSTFARRPRSLRDYVAGASGFGERECVVFEGGERVTFSGFERAVAGTATDLATRYGLQPGDRVALAGANSIEWLLAFWACVARGAVVAAMNAWWTPLEFERALDLVEPALVLTDGVRADRLPRSLAVPAARFEDAVSVDPQSGAPMPEDAISEDDDALLLFTSGTTGRPKAAVLTHANIVGFTMLQSFIGLRGLVLSGREPATEPPRRLAVFPLFHVSGLLGTAISSLATGTTTIWPAGRFDAARVIELSERERIGVWGGASTHVVRLLDDPALETFDGAQLVQVGIGGSASTPELIRRTEERFPHLAGTFSSGYGSTETGGLVSFAPNSLLRRAADCVGPPLPGVEVRVLDDTGRVKPEGAVGEVCVRSALVMREYWRNPDATRDAFWPDGWLRTGDFGWTAHGALHIASRLRDLILRGGENVYPFEVENRLDEHPAIEECAVFGVDDRTFGQVVHAAVVLRDGFDLDAEELRAHCAGVLSSYKVPDVIEIRAEPLPRNPAGKVMKHVLVGEASAFLSE